MSLEKRGNHGSPVLRDDALGPKGNGPLAIAAEVVGAFDSATCAGGGWLAAFFLGTDYPTLRMAAAVSRCLTPPTVLPLGSSGDSGGRITVPPVQSGPWGRQPTPFMRLTRSDGAERTQLEGEGATRNCGKPLDLATPDDLGSMT